MKKFKTLYRFSRRFPAAACSVALYNIINAVLVCLLCNLITILVLCVVTNEFTH